MQDNKQKKIRKIGMFVIMAAIFFVVPVFAAEESCSANVVGNLQSIENIFSWLGRIASRMWVLLANVAGKLMTNELIYGSFMQLDTFLWKIWQLSRTFSNYAIGLIFLYSILKYMLFPSGKDDTPVKKIKQLLIASVGVQASWFLVMVIVDLSTIVLATVSSFPSQVIANTEVYQQSLITNIKKDKLFSKPFQDPPKGVRINAFDDSFEGGKKDLWLEEFDLENKPENFEEQLIDQLLPSSNSLAGPLTYLGFSVFKTHSFTWNYEVKDLNCVDRFTKVLTSLMLDAGMIILYTLSLLVLIIILIFRVLYLWIFIATSPIIVLAATTKIISLEKIGDFLDLKKILKLIFQPVVFALWIGMMMLFIVIVQGFLSRNAIANFGQGSIKLTESSLSSTPGLTTDFKTENYRSDLTIGDSVKMTIAQGGKSLKDILLALIALALMRQFIKLAIGTTTGIKGLDNFTKKVLNAGEKIMGNIGVIPTPAGNIGFNQVRNNGESPIINTMMAKHQSQWQREESQRLGEIKKFLGIGKGIQSLTMEQHSSLKKAAQLPNDPHALIGLIHSYKKENEGIKFSEIKPYLPVWINANQSKGQELKKYLSESYTRKNIRTDSPENTEKDIEQLFSNVTVLQSFYEQVLGGKWENITYSQLNQSHYGEIPAK